MSIKTSVISARVPVDIANLIKKSCEKNNTTVSKYLTEAVTNPNQRYSKGGVVDVNMKDFTLPQEVEEILSSFGGLGVGMLVYKLLKTHLPEDRFDKESIENIALLSSFASGLGSMFALNKFMKKE